MTFPKWAYNICGNFGVGASAPFVGTNIGEIIYNLGFTIEQLVTISLAGASFNLILSISKEALERGKAKWK